MRTRTLCWCASIMLGAWDGSSAAAQSAPSAAWGESSSAAPAAPAAAGPSAPAATPAGATPLPPSPAPTLPAPSAPVSPPAAPSPVSVTAGPAPAPQPPAAPLAPDAAPPAQAPGPPAAPARAQVALPPPPPAKPTGIDKRTWIGAGIALGVLDMPKLAAGLQVRTQVRLPNMWPIDLAASYFLNNAAEFNAQELDLRANSLISLSFPKDGSRVIMSAIRASAGICPYERALEPGELQLCAGAFGEILRAKSEGLVAQQKASRGLFALEAYARWHFPLSQSVGVSYSAGLFVPFNRDRFGYADRFGAFATKFRIGMVGGRLDLALTHSF